MAYAIDANDVFTCCAIPPNTKENTILIAAFAVKKLPDFSAKVFAFRRKGAAERGSLKGENGCKQPFVPFACNF